MCKQNLKLHHIFYDYEGIQKLLPGCALLWDGKSVQIDRWYSLSFHPQTSVTEKDWTCKIYVRQRGGNDKEFKRLLNEFCDTIELENFEIPGKDAGVSWIRISDRYFDDDIGLNLFKF